MVELKKRIAIHMFDAFCLAVDQQKTGHIRVVSPVCLSELEALGSESLIFQEKFYKS